MPTTTARFALLLGAFALTASALPTHAQFGSILNSGKRGADKADSCGKGKKGDKGRGVMGGLLGGVAVGASAMWTSNTRDNVSGTSTVTSREVSSGDLDCIIVTDVVIVEGEEARADKRMCRAPGAARYSIVA